MTETDNDNDNAIAYAGVSLFGNRTEGPPPQWHELSAWRSGTLPEKRATQILSHVANDPEYFQHLLDLVEAEQWSAEEAAGAQADSVIDSKPSKASTSFSTDRLRHWLGSVFHQPLPVYGGAIAAVLLAVLVVPMMQQADSQLHQQLDDNLDLYRNSDLGLPAQPPMDRRTRQLSGLFESLSTVEVEQAHFQHGMRLSAEALGSEAVSPWLAWTTDLPHEALDCKTALEIEQCQASRDDLTALGQWTLLAYAACQTRTQNSNQTAIVDANVFWQAQLSLYEQLSQRPPLMQSTLFSPLLNTPLANASESLCERAQALLNIGL